LVTAGLLYWPFSTSLRTQLPQPMTASGGARPMAASPPSACSRHVRASRRIQPNDLLTRSQLPILRHRLRFQLSDLSAPSIAPEPYGQVYYSITATAFPSTPLSRSFRSPLTAVWRRASASSPHLPHHRLLTSSSAVGSAPRTHFSSLLPGLLSLLRPSSTQVARRLTGPSSGPPLAERCAALFPSLRLSFPEERFQEIAPQLALRSFYAQAPGSLASGFGPLKPASPLACSSIVLINRHAYDAAFYILAALLFLRSYARRHSGPPPAAQMAVPRTFGAVLPFTSFTRFPSSLT